MSNQKPTLDYQTATQIMEAAKALDLKLEGIPYLLGKESFVVVLSEKDAIRRMLETNTAPNPEAAKATLGKLKAGELALEKWLYIAKKDHFIAFLSPEEVTERIQKMPSSLHETYKQRLKELEEEKEERRADWNSGIDYEGFRRG